MSKAGCLIKKREVFLNMARRDFEYWQNLYKCNDCIFANRRALQVKNFCCGIDPIIHDTYCVSRKPLPIRMKLVIKKKILR